MRFQPSGGGQRNFPGLCDPASWQEGIGEPVDRGSEEKRLVHRPCRLNGPIRGDHGQSVVAELPQQ
jgi:hypothetical protein